MRFIQLPIETPVRLDIPVQLLIVCLISLLPHVFFQTQRIKTSVAMIGVTIGLIFVGGYASVTFAQTLLPLFDMIVALLAGTLVAVILKMIYSSSEQQFLRTAFSHFVSEDMLKELLRNPDKLSLQGKEMAVTIMFMDIRGFTTFSERISPQLVVNRLNELLDIVSLVIVKHGGHVNKFIGDSVMAMWGAPNPDKKQASQACFAALEIKKKIESQTEFQVGIGVHFGKAIVGNIGSRKRFDYTAIGDTVNTSSRLETASKEFKQTIIISAAVVAKLKEEHTKVEILDLGTTYLKGKLDEIHAYALKG